MIDCSVISGAETHPRDRFPIWYPIWDVSTTVTSTYNPGLLLGPGCNLLEDGQRFIQQFTKCRRWFILFRFNHLLDDRLILLGIQPG